MNFITAVLCVMIGFIFLGGPIGALIGFLIWFTVTTLKNK